MGTTKKQKVRKVRADRLIWGNKIEDLLMDGLHVKSQFRKPLIS